MGLVSQREYARMKGCSETAVRKAIKAGKIEKGAVRDENGKPKIDVEVADKEWASNYNPNYSENRETVAESVGGGGDNQKNSISEIKRAESGLKAKLLQLQLHEKTGQLVKKSDISKKLYEMGQEIRNSLMGIPARITDNLIEIKDRNEFQIFLENAIAEELEKLTDVVSRDL